MPSEELVTAIKAGYRYLLYSPQLQRLVIRTGLFMLFASVFWGLFPSLARFNFHANALSFGILYGFMGVGTVIGATVIPQMQEILTIDNRIILSTCVYAIGLFILSVSRSTLLSYLAMCFLGFSWIIIVASFNVHIQSIVAGWVKARAIGVYTVIFQGGLAIGSVLWGIIASHTSLSEAFIFAGCGMVITSIGAFRWPLHTNKALNMEYSFHWAQPAAMPIINPHKGPVLVTNAFEVEPKNHKAFLIRVKKLKDIRLRDGAIRWGIFHDTENKNKFIENFIVESWAEHLRQHARSTIADKELEDSVFMFNKGGKSPITTHYIAEGYS